MQILAALYSELSASTNGVAAYTSYRIYPNIAPQSAKLPYIVTQIIDNSFAGHTNVKEIKLYKPMISVNIWSSGYPQCREIAIKVRSALQDYRGLMGGAGGLTVSRSLFEDETELPDIDPQTMKPEFRIVQDYIIWHTSA